MGLNVLAVDFEAGRDESRFWRPHIRHEFNCFWNSYQLFPITAAH